MAEIKKLQLDGEDIYPITHTSAVYDSDGKSIEFKYISAISYQEGVDITVDGTVIPSDTSQLEASINELRDDVTELDTKVDAKADITYVDDMISNSTNPDTENRLSALEESVATLQTELGNLKATGISSTNDFLDLL